MYRGYIVYIGGCASKSRIFIHPVSNRTQNDLELGHILLKQLYTCIRSGHWVRALHLSVVNKLSGLGTCTCANPSSVVALTLFVT